MASSPRRSWSLSLMPPDIIQEIFYKTPAEALVRSKPTCQEWYALITDERFIKEHFQRSQEHFIRIFDTVKIMDPVTRTSSVSPVPNELLRHPFMIDTLAYTKMVRCDGFMLVACNMWKYRNDGSRYTNLALWNPVLRNLRWIEPSRSTTTSDYHGIGYDKNKPSDGYKILRFVSRPREIERHEDIPGVEIYECKTSSWRTLDVELDMDVYIMRGCVAAMGNMYWIAYTDEEVLIKSFDFSDETFKDICFCPPSYCDNSHLSCFGGDSLSLLQQDEASKQIEVWVSSKLGDGDVSFSKYFSLSGPDLPALRVHDDNYYRANPVYCFVKPKSVIVWCVGVEGEGTDEFRSFCTLYEINEDGVEIKGETERDNVRDYSRDFRCGHVFVPSMIPLPWPRDLGFVSCFISFPFALCTSIFCPCISRERLWYYMQMLLKYDVGFGFCIAILTKF